MKTAVVLSGGGAKGSMQFGFLKYLHEQGLKPDVVYGTSVGSLNAAGYNFCGIEGLEKVWESLKGKSSVFSLNWKFFFFMASGLYNVNPLRKLLEKYIVGRPRFESYACKVHLETGDVKYVHCSDANYIESTAASCSIPGLNDDIDGWVDGGVREQTPLKQAIKDGADKIIIILCNPIQKDPPYGKKGNWIKNILRTTDILSHEIFLNDIQNCIFYNRNPEQGKKSIELVVYAPGKLVINSDEFTQDKIQAAIQYGYEQAQLGPVPHDYIWKL